MDIPVTNADASAAHVIGTGLLAETIAAALGTVARADVSGQNGPVIAANDGWERVPDSVREASSALLPVVTELSQVVIGPWEDRGRTGCSDCAKTRRRNADSDGGRGQDALLAAHGDRLAAPSPVLTQTAADLVAALVHDDVESHAEGRDPRTRHALVVVDLVDLTVQLHRVLLDPVCAWCSVEIDDEPKDDLGTTVPLPAYRPGSMRGRDLVADSDDLVDTYFDPMTGLIRELHSWTIGSQIMTSATMAMRAHGGASGYGQGSRRKVSRTTAILESVERRASSPGTRRRVAVGSYHDFADRALDPRTLGLHPPEVYDRPDVGFEPFDPDRSYRWVWGWSFQRAEPILVPETLGYYGLDHHGPDGLGFVYEISNGCALGSSLHEAVLYGMLEVAERDAFLLTWYGRLPSPRIDLDAIDHYPLQVQVAALRAETGCDVRLYDISTEQGIPCIWAMALAPEDSGKGALACAAGSHLDPLKAMTNALDELSAGMHGMSVVLDDEGQAARAAAMVDDPEQVREMADHGLLYADRRAAGRLDFLTSLEPTRRPAGIGTDVGEFDLDDVGVALRQCVDRYLSTGLDVIAVDQTNPELEAAGLAVAKVLIPGTLSMTFGHRHRRTTDVPRALTAPMRAGIADRPLTEAELNPHPHPFP